MGKQTAPMLKNARNPQTYLCGNHYGCSCCNPKSRRRKGKKSARQAERRAWCKDQER